jgi:hypothetical protein
VSRQALLRAFALALGLVGFSGVGSAKAQDWTDYYHWPYIPPQLPANGFQYNTLYDGFYLYPREQRIVPQIQGPYYRNFYGGKRLLGHRFPRGCFHDWNKTWLYYGNHFLLDVF